jgi:uncharacterized protein (DUF2062 family)
VSEMFAVLIGSSIGAVIGTAVGKVVATWWFRRLDRRERDRRRLS